MSHFGDRIKARRVELGFTLQEVADGAGMNVGHVWQIENGNQISVSVRTLAKLDKALDVGPFVLFVAALKDATDADK